MGEVRMPELGETITEGTVTHWFKAVGDTATEQEALFEVSTDKVDAEVPSPQSGTITEIRVAVGQTVAVGTVVAVIDGDGPAGGPTAAPGTEAAEAAAPEPAAPPAPDAEPAAPQAPAPAPVAPAPAAPAEPAPSPLVIPDRLVTSPVVRRIINGLGPDAGLVTGTGPDGRITRKDAEKVAFSEEHLHSVAGRDRVASSARPSRSTSPSVAAAPPAPAGANFVPFNKTRRVTGDYMVASKAISPHVMTAVEVDYERIEIVRRTHQEQWRRDEGFTLTYLPFIMRALVQGLRDFPHLNASVAEGGLVLHDRIDISVAIDLHFDGLVAPAVRSAQDKRLGAIAREISDMAGRARQGKLRTEELLGGTFTVSNSGPFGTFMVAPVINQPQVAILSTDGVTRKPVVVTDALGTESIAIHSVGMLVLSWDHRAFDGAYAAAFLHRVKEVLETNDWDAEL